VLNRGSEVPAARAWLISADYTWIVGTQTKTCAWAPSPPWLGFF
jgi:hypothetical protein